MSETQDRLTLEQKKDLYRDGFIVLKKVISDELVQEALKRIKKAKNTNNY